MKRTLSALAAETAETDRSASAQIQEETMPHSISYFGQIQEIGRDAAGTITSLRLISEQSGEYVMHISPATVWIDSEDHAASDPAGLAAGEWVCVYHSPASTRSLPPQSPAYAVVRSFSRDDAAAKYHLVEAVTQNEGGGVTITTNNGGLWLTVEADAAVTAYDGGQAALSDLQTGDRVMAWYEVVLLSYPGRAGTGHLMFLPPPSD